MKNLLIYCSLLVFLSACANCLQMNNLKMGMTEQEAINVMDRSPNKVRAAGNSKIIYYSCRGSMPNSGIKFIDNRLVAYGPEDNVNIVTAPLPTPPDIWTKDKNFDPEQFYKDKYDCAKQAEGNPSSANTSLSVIVGEGSINNTTKRSASKEYAFFVMCLEAKGYKRK